MNRIVRYILLSLVGAGLIVGCAFAYAAASRARSGVVCTRLNLVIKDSTKARFVCLEDVSAVLHKECGDFLGKRLDSLDICSMEKAVRAMGAVESAEVYVTADSSLNVVLTQKKPVLRFQSAEGGFYVDAAGSIFPLQKRWSARVPVVDGNIPVNVPAGYCGEAMTIWEQDWIAGIMDLENYISSDPLWRRDIAQVHIDRSGDIVLIPRQGNEKFIFGSPVEIPQKFSRIEHYYKCIVPKAGEDCYRSVNVKFDRQIICRK